ncbi:MAG TPA: alginate export family protein [Vicinamibacterales bacterium]|nr:alginate export family protein [Vicinamibacterales bacterium]
MTLRLLLACTLLACEPASLAAQPAADPDPGVAGHVSNTTRVESWRFFEPPLAGVDPRYTFFGNRSDLGLQVRAPRFDLSGGFSYVRVERLPTDAIGPGGLGTGAFYFASSGLPYSYQVFLTELTVAAHTRGRRVTVTAGRMRHTSGAEGTHVEPGRASPHLTEVRRMGLDGRLLGTFDWSFYQRRFDGVRVDVDGDRRYAGAGAFLVTQGVFEESANLTMTRLQVGTTYLGWRHGGAGETQVFAHAYRDRRAIDFRPDNAAAPTDAANVSLYAVGASHVGTVRVGTGDADWLAWGAAQGGDWYGQVHRADAAAIEGGYRWSARAWTPWLRVGVSYASGDHSPSDLRHETFFPMLADVRTYAQSMVYAPMNLRDGFIRVLARPHPRAQVRVDLHRLDLIEVADRWYQGGGATTRDGRFFGYSTRASGGARGLGTVLEASADVRVSRYWSINGYAARMWGGPVVRTRFASDRLVYWYVENVLRLDLKTP